MLLSTCASNRMRTSLYLPHVKKIPATVTKMNECGGCGVNRMDFEWFRRDEQSIIIMLIIRNHEL